MNIVHPARGDKLAQVLHVMIASSRRQWRRGTNLLRTNLGLTLRAAANERAGASQHRPFVRYVTFATVSVCFTYDAVHCAYRNTRHDFPDDTD